MKKTITIVSSISSLLFIIALVWFGAGIYIDKKGGTEKANIRYERLLADTKENFSKHVYGTSEFANSFINAIGNIDDFSTLKLEINGETVYSYPPSSFSLPSPELVKSYSETVSMGSKSFTLKASIYLMTPGTIYSHSRLAFLLILAGTLFAGVVIVIMSGKEKDEPDFSNFREIRHSSYKNAYTKNEEIPESKSTSVRETNESELKEKPIEDNKTDEVKNPAQQKEELSQEAELIWKDDDIFDDADEESDDESGLDIIDQFEQANQNLQENNFLDYLDETESEESPENEESSEEKGSENESFSTQDELLEEEFEEPVFNESLEINDQNTRDEHISPVTGLLLQSELGHNLDDTIEKGKSQATLAIVKINGLDRGNTISGNIASILKNDCSDATIFEYNADSYALVLPDRDLQETVDSFEKIYNKIEDYLKDSNATNEVSVGISSASGRSIKADRIILEADQALQYASQDRDSAIVAFRANPERYKEFIENQ